MRVSGPRKHANVSRVFLASARFGPHRGTRFSLPPTAAVFCDAFLARDRPAGPPRTDPCSAAVRTAHTVDLENVRGRSSTTLGVLQRERNEKRASNGQRSPSSPKQSKSVKKLKKWPSPRNSKPRTCRGYSARCLVGTTSPWGTGASIDLVRIKGNKAS